MTCRQNIRRAVETVRQCLFVSLCIAVAGCNSPAPKLAQVKLQTVNHTVIFNNASTRLSSYQIEHLQHFVGMLPIPAVSYVSLASNPGDRYAAARTKLIRNYLVHEGVYASLIHTIPPFTPMDKQSLLMTVQYTQGVPPGPCPDWSKNSLTNYNNTDMSNFGCAYNSNLAVQVADPADLYGGHAFAETEGTRDSVVIGKYMSDTPAPTTTSSSGGSSAASSSGSGITSSP